MKTVIGLMLCGLVSMSWAETATEKFCRANREQKALVEKRLARGNYPWERKKLEQKLEELDAVYRKRCAEVAAAPAPAKTPARSGSW